MTDRNTMDDAVEKILAVRLAEIKAALSGPHYDSSVAALGDYAVISREEIDALVAFAERASSAGLVLAPREATEEMLNAVFPLDVRTSLCALAGCEKRHIDEETIHEIWSAMIAASSKGPSQGNAPCLR